MADHLTQLAQGELQQIVPGMPDVIAKRHRDAASQFFAEAGTEAARYLSAQQQIDKVTGEAEKKAKEEAIKKFLAHEMQLPRDPVARRNVLLNRLPIEQGAGVPTATT